MSFVDMQVKWSVTLTDRLGPEILTVLEIKGQVLHRVRLHVKVQIVNGDFVAQDFPDNTLEPAMLSQCSLHLEILARSNV